MSEIFVRKCSDLSSADVSILPRPFNGSDDFTNIIGITLFGGYLYVLDETEVFVEGNPVSGPVRVVWFDTEDLSYVGEYFLEGINWSVNYISPYGIDNDGTYLYVTARDGNFSVFALYKYLINGDGSISDNGNGLEYPSSPHTIDHFADDLYVVDNNNWFGNIYRYSKGLSDILDPWTSQDADLAQFGDPEAEIAKNPNDATILLLPSGPPAELVTLYYFY